MPRQYRRLRIIEYTGTQDWIEACVNRRSVKGKMVFPQGVIQEAWLGETSELLQEEPPNPNDRPRTGTALEHEFRPEQLITGQTVKWSRPAILPDLQDW